MEISIAPHKLLPNLSSYDEPGPRSNCYIKVDNPHISNYYAKRGEIRVKVNARSVCSYGHHKVKLTVEIWKDGRVGSNFVKKFSTNPFVSSSVGNLVELKSASVPCRDLRPTNYFAYAYGKAEVNGKNRRTPVAVTEHINLRRGT